MFQLLLLLESFLTLFHDLHIFAALGFNIILLEFLGLLELHLFLFVQFDLVQLLQLFVYPHILVADLLFFFSLLDVLQFLLVHLLLVFLVPQLAVFDALEFQLLQIFLLVQLLEDFDLSFILFFLQFELSERLLVFLLGLKLFLSCIANEFLLMNLNSFLRKFLTFLHHAISQLRPNLLIFPLFLLNLRLQLFNPRLFNKRLLPLDFIAKQA